MEKLLILSLIAVTLFFFPVYMINAEKTEKKRDILKATFAGGCFWCVESDFEKVEGVIEAVSGYTGGFKVNPTYEEVSAGATGHAEAVQVVYDPSKVSYEELLDVFWRHIDPTDAGGQFVDRGSQYRSAIFYHNEEQREIAEESKAKLSSSGIFEKDIVTDIVPLGEFYRAEDYHQDYYNTHKIRYKFYRFNSGRDQYLESIWKTKKKGGKDPELFKSTEYVKPEEKELKSKLTPLQYEVTQKEGTEPPFKNEYWDNKREGIYVDIVTGEPLFSSTAKFESGTGWPSFTKPINEESIIKREDGKLLMSRTEVRSRFGDSHLGHVFDDGPEPTGLRYCINSAALRFIPKEDLKKEGYEEYLKLFD